MDILSNISVRHIRLKLHRKGYIFGYSKKDVHQNIWVINFKGCDEKTYIFIAERDIHSKKIV